MNIIVCLKQVPNAAYVKLDPVTHTLNRENISTIINPFDLFAIEAALRLKEEFPAETTNIKALSMGPPQASEVIKEAIGFGIDEGLLLSDQLFAGADTWATTVVLAAGIRKLGGADCIICGKQAIDGETAQVGPGLAYRLGIPHVAFVKGWVKVATDYLIVLRQMDEGYDIVHLPLPALITVLREVGEPRPPRLNGKIRAKNYKVPIATAIDLGLSEFEVGLNGSHTQVEKIFSPKFISKQKIIPGTASEAGRAVIDQLVKGEILLLGN